jgi:protein-L-isoaspartate(D-aspartate) O-methyltransferase
MTARNSRRTVLALFACAALSALPEAAALAEDAPSARGGALPPRASGEGEHHAMNRTALVDELRRDGIKDARVLGAIGRVPRHEFVPPALRADAYENYPLPIGEGQTISQPYIVAFMTEVATLQPGANVLEVGTGSGYQAAILADILGLGPDGGEPRGKLASMETIPSLAEGARHVLERLGYAVDVRTGDGYRGWPERAPFDAILVTAAPDHVPAPLKEQLAIGGRLVIPVGDADQQLMVITRTERGFREETVLPVRFVPMTGEAQRRPR